VIASALQQAMTPFWESHFLDISHGFRPRRNVQTLLRDLGSQILQQHRTVILTADIRKAFDSVRIQDVMDAHHHHTQDQQLLDLVATVLVDPHSKRRRGIDQGNPYSPAALNVVLHHHLDAPIQQAAEQPLLLRYADDMTISAGSVSECQETLEKARNLLQPLGLTLVDKGPPVDLSQKDSVVRVLGLELRLEQGKLTYGVPEDAWVHLGNQLMEAHLEDHPARVARQVCQGWLQGYAMALANVTEQHMVARMQSTLEASGFREISNKDVQRWINSGPRTP
jgi:hypothetical protein